MIKIHHLKKRLFQCIFKDCGMVKMKAKVNIESAKIQLVRNVLVLTFLDRLQLQDDAWYFRVYFSSWYFWYPIDVLATERIRRRMRENMQIRFPDEILSNSCAHCNWFGYRKNVSRKRWPKLGCTPLFHYLPNYPTRLTIFFTTEGDNWRDSKMKASLVVLS